MVRGKVVEKYSDLIQFINTAEGKKIDNDKNIEAIINGK
jgi:hypothetical protein